MPRTEPPALELRNVSAGYAGEDAIVEVDFTLAPQDFLGVIGPNGGGKTTLLKVILGLLEPHTGSVRVFGKTPAHARRLLGYAPQHSHFDRRFPIRVWDVVLMGRLGARGWKPFYTPRDRDIARDALEQVGMEAFRDHHIAALSGGERQRVFIARALTQRPRIILLDEPTASVDQKMQVGIYELLKELNRQATIVLVTHDIGVISAYVKQVACLNRYFIYHGTRELSQEMLNAAYECPVDIIAHGLPHRVFSHDMPEAE